MSYYTEFRVLRSARSETDHASPAKDHPLVRELRSMTKLQPGWSYGEGQVISEAVVAKAETVLNFGVQLQLRAEVFPGREGQVAIAFHRDKTCVQVTVNPDGSLGLRVERGHGLEYEDAIEPIEKLESESDVYGHIIDLAMDDAWKSRASSTSSTLVGYEDVSSILPSRTPAA